MALRALKDPRLFTERYLSPDIQYLDWYEQVDEHLAQYDDVLVLAFPGSGKSTRLSFIETLMAICRDRSVRIGFFSKTEDKAKLFMLNVARELRTNPRLIRDFGIFFDPRDKDCYDSQTRIRVTGALGKKKEPTIINFGTSSQYESIRLDLLVLDDPVDLKTSRSSTETAWVEKTLGSLMDRLDPEGRLIIVGHRFLPHDFYDLVLSERPHIHPLILSCWNPDGSPLAYPVWTRETLERRLRKKKKWERQAYYMQQPIPPEDNVFSDIQIHYEIDLPEVKGKMAAADPAYTAVLDMKSDPDWSVTIAGIRHRGGILITDINDWRINRGWANKFCNFASQAEARTVHVEINNAQTLGEEMKEYSNQHSLHLSVKPFKSKRGKEYRIGDLADWAQENGIYVLERLVSSPAFKRLKDQWDNYPNVNHDDHLDCLDMLRRALATSRRVGARVAHI